MPMDMEPDRNAHTHRSLLSTLTTRIREERASPISPPGQRGKGLF